MPVGSQNRKEKDQSRDIILARSPRGATDKMRTAENNKFQGEKLSFSGQKDPDEWVTKDEPSKGAQPS